MQVYWSLKSIPELAPLPPQERTRVWQACVRRSFTQWQTWAGIFLPPICAWAPTLALDRLLVWLGMPPVVAYLATFPIFVVGFLGGMVLQRHIILAHTRPYLRAYLAQLTPAPRQDADAH